LKLDELIKGVKGARTSLVDLEELSDAELEHLHKEFEQLHKSETRSPKRQEDQQSKPDKASTSRREAKTKT